MGIVSEYFTVKYSNDEWSGCNSRVSIVPIIKHLEQCWIFDYNGERPLIWWISFQEQIIAIKFDGMNPSKKLIMSS